MDQDTVPAVKKQSDFMDQESGSQVSINAKLSSWIRRISTTEIDDTELRAKCTEICENPPKCVSLSFINKVAICASQWQERGKTPKSASSYNSDFLDGVKWYFAEGPAPQKRDYENESAVERIRNDAAAREYARMTKNVGVLKKGEALGSFAKDLKAASNESVAVFNCLLTVIGAGVFAFFATGMAIEHLVAQVLVAVLVSCIVAVADIYFLLRKLHQNDLRAEESVGKNQSETRQLSSTSGAYQKSKDI